MYHLKHTALYAKGYYQRSNNIVADLIKILNADGMMPSNKWDVSQILLNNYDSLPFHGYSKVRSIVEGISPSNVWKVGYYCKGNSILFKEELELPEYDYHIAVIMFVLSNIAMSCLDDLGGELIQPDENILPLYKK